MERGVEVLDIREAIILIERQCPFEYYVDVLGDSWIQTTSRLELCFLDQTLDTVGRYLAGEQGIDRCCQRELVATCVCSLSAILFWWGEARRKTASAGGSLCMIEHLGDAEIDQYDLAIRL